MNKREIELIDELIDLKWLQRHSNAHGIEQKVSEEEINIVKQKLLKGYISK